MNSDGVDSNVTPWLSRILRDSAAYFSMQASLQYSEGGVASAEHCETRQVAV